MGESPMPRVAPPCLRGESTVRPGRTMDSTITFTVNGERRTVTTDPQRPLLDVLREELQLTGTKYGCGEGRCGACSVLVDGKRTFSCRTDVEAAKDKAVATI